MTASQPITVVTGAGSGMGAATAARFVAEGHTVAAFDRDRGALDHLVATHGSAIEPREVDVTDRDAVESAIAGVAELGQLVAVVNAAGIYPPSTLSDLTEELYRRIFDVNVLGTLNVIAATAPLLRRGGGGAIVNFASVDAFAVSPGQLLYSASKGAVVTLTRSLGVELAADGITVNAVAPGWVDTPGTRAGGRMAAAVASIPAGRAADPAEIAHWVWQLTRGTYVTGETLVISGGVTVR
jgi:3-oxoacyl-[acyl-carrier protein] reductase